MKSWGTVGTVVTAQRGVDVPTEPVRYRDHLADAYVWRSPIVLQPDPNAPTTTPTPAAWSTRSKSTKRPPKPATSRESANRRAHAEQATRRTEIVASAREALAQAGATWAEAKAWALTHGFRATDVGGINPDVIDAYLKGRQTAAPAPAAPDPVQLAARVDAAAAHAATIARRAADLEATRAATRERLAATKTATETTVRTQKRAWSDLETELKALAGESPDVIADRLGVTPGAIAQALNRNGRRPEAVTFWAAQKRRRDTGGTP